MATVATKVEILRRLKEQCERRAKRLWAKGMRQAADEMAHTARMLGWEIENLEADQRFAEFAARLED